MKQLRILQASALPVDTSAEARLAALEGSSAAGFACTQEAGPAIQGLQIAVGQTAARVEELGGEIGRHALQRAELVKATRRELLAVLGLPGDQINGTEPSPNGHAATVVEAKLVQPEGSAAKFQSHSVCLSEREAVVGGVLQQREDAKPQDESAVTNAFAHVDAKINQAGEIVRKFGSSGAPAVHGVTSPFTVKKRDPM